jgi:hypothetical protein
VTLPEISSTIIDSYVKHNEKVYDNDDDCLSSALDCTRYISLDSSAQVRVLSIS